MRTNIVFFLMLLLASCIPQKKLEYLQDPVLVKDLKWMDGSNNVFKGAEKHKIKPNDELLIKVSSFDDVSFNFFNVQGAQGSLQASNELSLNAISYSVDVDGNVYFPVIGKIKLGGLTLDEARDEIQLTLASYFDQPNVQIKYAFKKVSVLGEVNAPGYYTYTKDQITILEAIAMARDLTIHGNRSEIQLVRTVDNNRAIKYEIDLTDDNIVFNYNYYLQPGDIVYIKPRRSVKWREISTPASLLFSTITTLLLVYNAIQN